jgi:hypothetical protein
MVYHPQTEANLNTNECVSQALASPVGGAARASVCLGASPFPPVLKGAAVSGKCGAYFLTANDAFPHYWGKRLLDHKEWCPKCGKNDSAAHLRRQARWISDIQQLSKGLYIVVEWPLSYRLGMRSKVALRQSADVVLDVIAGKHTRLRGSKGFGRVGGIAKRGKSRWHWFNDERPGYRADVFNPHVNFLLDRGKLSRRELANLKVALRSATGCPGLIVHARYGSTAGWLVHEVKYITRATFTNREWDTSFADELFNFRNVRSFGKWDDSPAWELKRAEAEGEDISGLQVAKALHEHTCPDCSLPLEIRGYRTKLNKKSGEREFVYDKVTGLPIPVYWSKPLPSIFLEVSGAVEVAGSEYYRIPALWAGCDRELVPQLEKIPLSEVHRANSVRLKGLEDEVVRERREANLRAYLIQVAKEGWKDGVH